MYSKDTQHSGVEKYERYHNDDDRGNVYEERVSQVITSVFLLFVIKNRTLSPKVIYIKYHY